MFLENYIVDVIEARRGGQAIEQMLYGLSRVYRHAIRLRHWAYDKRWIKSAHAPVPVVSVGNIVTGGTGKTPFVRLLAETLMNESKVAILTRGFRSKIERSGDVRPILQNDGSLLPPEVCGDEPYWLATALPQVSVWVGRNRAQSAQEASAEGAQIILLDDGMQHRQLARDFEVVLMDAEDMFGKGHFLPRGYLREIPERLKIADLIVINHVRDAAHGQTLKKQLTAYTSAPVIGMQTKLLKDLAGKKIAVFCGIGKPERFLSALRDQGAEIINQLITRDHMIPSKKELIGFARRSKAKKAELLVCTEKDAVKLPPNLKTSLPILPVEACLEIVMGREHWDRFIKNVKGKI